MFPLLWVPELSQASATSFSQKQLTRTELQAVHWLFTDQLNSVIHQLASLRVRVTLWLVVYCQSIHLGTKPFEDHDQRRYGHSPYVTSSYHPAYNILTWTALKTLFLIVVVQLLQWKHACLWSCYLVTAVVYLLISRLMPSKGSTCHNTINYYGPFNWQKFIFETDWAFLVSNRFTVTRFQQVL
jgi:hypothetical protein